MVVKIYISSISGNSSIKKHQADVARLLSSKKIEFEEIDISDSTKEEDKKFMRENGNKKGNQTVPLPPQIFNDDKYCGDYEDLEEANEVDELYEFLKLAPQKEVSQASVTLQQVNLNILKDNTNALINDNNNAKEIQQNEDIGEEKILLIESTQQFSSAPPSEKKTSSVHLGELKPEVDDKNNNTSDDQDVKKKVKGKKSKGKHNKGSDSSSSSSSDSDSEEKDNHSEDMGKDDNINRSADGDDDNAQNDMSGNEEHSNKDKTSDKDIDSENENENIIENEDINSENENENVVENENDINSENENENVVENEDGEIKLENTEETESFNPTADGDDGFQDLIDASNDLALQSEDTDEQAPIEENLEEDIAEDE